MRDPALIALDWGTSSLRAWCLDCEGRILNQEEREDGLMQIPPGGFEAAFTRLVAPWRRVNPALPALACGMIGSAQGWVEAPYQSCPAGPAELAEAMISVPGQNLYIVPGVSQRHPAANVMRGEETQIAGALQLRPELGAESLLLMPGTHSKWVTI